MEARKLEEIRFHDLLREGQYEQRWSPEGEARTKGDALWSNFKYYAIERDSLDLMKRWSREYGVGGTVLDYCCGNGEESFSLAKEGARHVTGIDISPVSIENCRRRAKAEGLEDRLAFRVMDAESIEYEDSTFDLVMEYGVLHHLRLEVAMSELARVLKPEGSIVCTETLGHNPFIRLYRRLTPDLRTRWEVDHILRRKSFSTMARYFGKIEKRFYHLATLCAVPFRNARGFGALLSSLRQFDRVILSVRGIQWQAWQVVFRLSEPIKRRSSRVGDC